MPLYQAVVLAIVQAFTEFLPISSQAHLWFVPWVFKWKDPGLTFDVALHAGTLVAVIIYFFRDWIQIIAHGFGINACFGSWRSPRFRPLSPGFCSRSKLIPSGAHPI